MVGEPADDMQHHWEVVKKAYMPLVTCMVADTYDSVTLVQVGRPDGNEAHQLLPPSTATAECSHGPDAAHQQTQQHSNILLLSQAADGKILSHH